MRRLHRAPDLPPAGPARGPECPPAPLLRQGSGDMSNTERILVGMDLRTAEEKRAAAERTPRQP